MPMFRLFQLARTEAATPTENRGLWDDFRFRLPHASANFLSIDYSLAFRPAQMVVVLIVSSLPWRRSERARQRLSGFGS